MQLRTPMRLIPVLAVFFLLASCSKTNEQGKLIPNDASIVVHLNGQSLSAKLPWEEIKGNVLFQKLYADSTIPTFIKNVLDNPDNSGVNIKSDLVFFVKMDSLGTLMGFEGSIKDAGKFKLFNLDVTKGGSESEKDGVNYISHAPLCVGWTKEKFVYVFNSQNFSMKHYPGMPGGMSNNNDGRRDIGAACKSIFDLKEKNSLSSNEKFTELVKKEGDIHFWMNSEELTKSAASIPALSMMKMDKLFEGTVTTATANFENGKITVDYKTYTSKILSDLLKKYSGGTVNEDMLKRIPSKDVAAVFALNFKPEGIQELLKTMGMDGLANLGLSSLGFSLDDFVKANKGDILIAVTDFKAPKKDVLMIDTAGGQVETNTHSYFGPQVNYLFSASIGDKEAFNKLIAAGKKMMGPQMDDSAARSISIMPKFAYSTNANYFAIGNSKENVDKYIAGGSSNNFDFISKMSGSPLGGYINLQYIMKAMEPEMASDSSAKIAFDASLKMWDNVYITGGKYNGGSMSYNMEINLVDKTSNSLKQLNQYLGKLGQLMMEKKKRMELTDVQLDEIKPGDMPPPPPPPVKKNK